MTNTAHASADPRWVSLLGNPQAVRNVYGEDVPTLDGFLLEAFIVKFDKVMVAGQLNRPPRPSPPKWFVDDRARADLVLDLVDVRQFSLRGCPLRGERDDSMHGGPEGSPVNIILEALSEPYIAAVDPPIYWKRLSAQAGALSLVCEAGIVQAWVGPEWRRRQFRP